MVQGRTEFKKPTTVSSIIEKEELEILEDIRWRERLGRSEVIRKAIQEYSKNHSQGNDTYKLTEWAQNPEFIAMPAVMSPNWNEYIRKHTDRKERDKLYKQLDFISMTIKSQNHMEDMEK